MSRKSWSQILASSPSSTNTNNTNNIKSNPTQSTQSKKDVSASLDTYIYTPYGGKDALIKMLNKGRVIITGNFNDLVTVLTTVSGVNQLPTNNGRTTHTVNNIGVVIQNCGNNGYMAYFGNLHMVMAFSLHRSVNTLTEIAKNAVVAIALLGNRMEVTFSDINEETVTVLMSLITSSNAHNCVIK